MRTDLSFLSVVADGPDDYVIGNGETFVHVPGVAAAVVAALDGTRTAAEARARVLAERGVDVDVEAFVTGLDGAGLLRRPHRPPNLWDRIRPGHVAWFFSRPADAALLLLTGSALAAAVARPGVLPSPATLVWADSLAFTLAFAAGSWLLVLVHELGHIAAARSLGVRAELSLGTRMQFLVVQTRITGVWAVPRRARYRAHLAGMRVDWLLACACACVLYVAGPSGSPVARLIMVICLAQIAWQFLFFMRTDVYYAVANATGDKNLMADARAYLRGRRGGARRAGARRSVRVYAWFLVVGRALGLAFFAGYTVPVTVAICRRSLEELAGPGGWRPVAALAVVAAGWLLYLGILLRRRTGTTSIGANSGE
ncbi:hypothetical protein [Nonomuraea sp. SBT364]|uniref:hypothetical protein n=1 Tax=Nonomuraea sp. SBT364 TaxID=1580530 RepID=UPI00066CA14D|nr:hypothetical protein [Nonomuraea sp. SBT364]